ncbi:astacin-like metalloprotease toxin 5 [Dermacentor variabilis]|uniref:astacin-like metalloprotease toxin 5 n=1 Tax=Dermacentor variabilis TaxID=34621 RepID=UPI003F5AF2CE
MPRLPLLIFASMSLATMSIFAVILLASGAPIPPGPPTGDVEDRTWLEVERPVQRAGHIEGDNVSPEGRTLQVNAITIKQLLWPGATIPYTISPELKNQYELIRKAMDSIENVTCVRFVERTNEKDYIKIFSGKGCYAEVGHLRGVQPVSLGNGCLYLSTIEHELLHAVGFFHEQMRPDRDQYITIIKENIDPEYESQFQKLHPGKHDNFVPFDTNSVMLYGGHAFAREQGLTTMTANDGTVLIPLYNKTGLSDTDILSVNILYNCPN